MVKDMSGFLSDNQCTQIREAEDLVEAEYNKVGTDLRIT
jgi:hypothetical protein